MGGAIPPTSTLAGGKDQTASPKVRQARLPSTKESTENCGALGQQSPLPAETTSQAGVHGRPHSSGAMRDVSSLGGTEGGRVDAPNNQSDIRIPAKNAAPMEASLRGRSAHVNGNRPKQPTLRRPQTADGRDIEVLRHITPFLDDPADPVMIAHRYVPTTVALTMHSNGMLRENDFTVVLAGFVHRFLRDCN